VAPIGDDGKAVVGKRGNDGNNICCVDIETQQVINHWAFEGLTVPSLVLQEYPNQVLFHRGVSLILAAFESRFIRFFDPRQSKCVHSIVGHQDAVTSLALDPSGHFFASAGHDRSVRFWDLSRRMCVQEFTSHRKKFDEAVHSISYHPSRSMFASGGADSVVHVYQTD
jgi:WD40 repeat protein